MVQISCVDQDERSVKSNYIRVQLGLQLSSGILQQISHAWSGYFIHQLALSLTYKFESDEEILMNFDLTRLHSTEKDADKAKVHLQNEAANTTRPACVIIERTINAPNIQYRLKCR